MKIHLETKKALLELDASKGICLEGNIIKVIDSEGDEDFKTYLADCLERDQTNRRKRLEVTKQVQTQNSELQTAQSDLKKALLAAQNAKDAAEQDLTILQKRTQFRLMHRIVNVSLGVVISVGLISTLVYLFSLHTGNEVERIGTVWSSLVGILLTNSFSILGTIMGVKYANDKIDN